MTALAFEQVEVTFAGRGGDYTAVRDTTLHVAEGEFVSVVGPTGCGKSTLLNLAAGLLAPTRGEVRGRWGRRCWVSTGGRGTCSSRTA